MGLRIHGIARSRAFRNIWAAEEAGVPYEHLQVDFSDTGCRAPAFRALNPNAKIPTIEDGDFKLWESMAINLYIAKKYAPGRLYPAELAAEATAWMWSFWVMTEIEPNALAFLYNTAIWEEARRDPKAAAEGREKLNAPFGVLDAHLAATPYLLGGEFGIADLNVASVLYTLRAFKFDFAPWPKLAAWLDRCLERPGCRAARRLRE
jgi:glutathione S-transferase